VFNYPCVVDSAPGESYCGHSSHVMNVKFSPGSMDKKLVSVGGNDNSAMSWVVM
jgi:WD40 repeat protein